MKINLSVWVGLFVSLLSLSAMATVRYVNVNSTNPAPPYTDWTNAATDIQDAIDASTNGDTVLVTNGVYASGGRVMVSGPTNRVVLESAVTVQSVNGPWVTIIQGAGAVNGPSAVRCAWLTNNAALIGFTLQGGARLLSGVSLNGDGGGVCCTSVSAVVDNCVIVSNTAANAGCGVYQGTLNNCLITGNGGTGSGAVYDAVLNNCTVVSNSVPGAYSSSVTNSILYYNTLNNNVENYSSIVAAAYCCTIPSLAGKGNISSPPQLFTDGAHLLSTSPCIGAGTNLVTGTDIFGNAWADLPSMGCAEYSPSPLIAPPSINLIRNPVEFALNAVTSSTAAPSFFWLQNGVPLQNNGTFSGVQTTNLIVSGINLGDAGSYQLVASNTFGVTTSAVVNLAIHGVNAAGMNPVPPYVTWATAATNIQDAINASASGDIVLVTNGLYDTGAESMDGVSSNRVSLNKAIRVQSVNGPWVTTIQGGGATNGTSAIRCASLTNSAALVGFTLEGGATMANASDDAYEEGGGVWCASSNAFVYNCVIVSNTSYWYGGGAYQGSLFNCYISSNSSAGGSYAVFESILNNCTIVSNAAIGVFSCPMTNSIVYYNAGSNPNGNHSGTSTGAYCCTTPAIAGSSNFITAPGLSADGIHLSTGSPCIHTGTNVVIGTDVFGQAWANPPSVGCAEYNPNPSVTQPQITLTGSPVGFAVGNATSAGQQPLSYSWLENGIPLQNNGHFSGTQTTNLVAIGVSLADAGNYQLVVSNASGVVTSAVAPLIVHVVNLAGANPEPPFLSWANAATNIQEAIESASPGDIVLVTNGIYDTGGEVMAGTLTNRIALDRAVMVASVNGWGSTVIEGAWDPVSTNGPNAVRCAWLTNGAILSGFSLQGGATQNTGNSTAFQSGGGVLCASTNALVSNCVLSNNFANYGGGIGFGTLNNSLVMNNVAASGGGAYNATLNNCTVEDNYTTVAFSMTGGGTYGGVARNSIVVNNGDGFPFEEGIDNYATSGGAPSIQYSYSCTVNSLGQAPAGAGNTSADPHFLDLYHLSINSPCRGAGSALYASGTDLDGESWNNPPSIGCDEVVVSNRTGPLSVTLSSEVVGYPPQTNVLVNHLVWFEGTISGLAASLAWNFGDGSSISNVDYFLYHHWTSAGSYNVVFTAYNANNPTGVSTNMVIQVVPVNPPQLQPPVLLSNGIQFEFASQINANYTVQYATNLTPPVNWFTLQSMEDSTGGVYQIQDSPPTNAARFYRVESQ